MIYVTPINFSDFGIIEKGSAYFNNIIHGKINELCQISWLENGN